jgi:5,10-methylenetetrahydrofolate reductase
MLNLKNFPISVELSSSASSDISKILDTAQKLHADFFNIPDGILGRLTIDPIVLAARIYQITKIPTIAHLTCRDSTKLGLASRLLGAANLNIAGILALTGDAAKKNVFEIRAPELVSLIHELNTGKFGEKQLTSKTNLKIGVAVNPNVSGQIDYLQKKIATGADFVQTQPVFSLEVAEKFLTAIKKAKITVPIMLGIMPLKNVKIAEYFNEKVVGVEIPTTVVERLREEENAGVKIALELLAKIKDQITGVHLMPLGSVINSNKIYESLKKM